MRKNKKKIFVVLLLSALIFGSMGQGVLHAEKKGAITADAAATTGHLKVVVRDANSNLPIADVEFNVINWLGRVVATMKSDQLGEAKATIGIGIYKVRETKVPAGYVLNTWGQLVTIWKNYETGMTFTNKKEPVKAGKLVVKSADITSGAPLAGAEFVITDTTGKTSATVVTNSFGEATAELPIGKYHVQEKKAAAGYALNSGVQSFTLVSGGTVSAVFYNAKVPAAVGKIAVKTYAMDTKTALAGVEFNVIDKAGKAVATLITSGSGEASIDLPVGEYQVKQTKAPSGYTIHPAVQSITVVPGSITTATFYNPRAQVTGGKVIAKALLMDTKLPLAGVEYTVLDTAGNAVATLTTNDNGETSIDLPAGSYRVKQTKVPTGYILNPAVQAVTVTSNSVTTVSFSNLKELEQVGKLIVQTFDIAAKTPVAGVEYTVSDTAGTVVGVKTTDASGTLSLDLPVGNYEVRQTKIPAGYFLNPSRTSFKIDAGSTITATMYNQKG